MKLLLKNLNNNINEHKQDDENVLIDRKYYNVYEIPEKTFRPCKFSLLQLNIASLGDHKDELEDMPSILGSNFDIIGLTETRIL